MATHAGFPQQEFDARLARVRACMEAAGLDGLLVTAPENIFYLTGLNHQGYFAYESLIVPLEGEPALVTRAMERATVRDQVPWCGTSATRTGSSRCRRRATARATS